MLNEHGEDFEQERLRLVIEGTRLGMWDWNPQTDEVVFNDLWAEMLGHRIEEIPFTLESWSSRVHPDDLDGCYADITRHINGETSFYENIHRMRHKDGSWRYILDRGRIVERDADGNPTRFTGTHTDLTPQIEAELAAKEALKAKDRFLARVSHEIRPPLHGVLGLVGLLDQTGLNEEQRAITAHMRGSGETLLVLINDLLDVTKAAEGKLLLDPTAVDVAELTGEVAALFHPLAATKGLSVDWRCDDALPARVFVDGHRLKQVLSNLLSNAIKFTEHGGIRLEACVDRTAEGERVVFRLEDDGMGIAHPDRVWEAFEQDNARIAREHGGTGLGLTVVRHLVALLGGEIAVHSRVGIGTTFEFWIPARAVPAGLDAPEPAAMGDVSSLAVLVADDSPVNQLIARGLLER